MNNINWDGLRYFVAAAESGSLTAAAKQLDSNQPTVGRQIDGLETALGIKLFQRSVKGLLLTEEGAFILEQAQLIQTSIAKIQRTPQTGADSSGTVRLALPEGLSLEVLVPQLSSFYEEYPHIQLILEVSSSSADLIRGEADIAVRLFRPKENNLVSKRLGYLSQGLFASKGYLASHGCPTDVGALRGHPMIAYGDQLSALPANQWLIEHTNPSSRLLCSDSTATRLQATIAGVGISIQPHIICQRHSDLVPLLTSIRLPGHELWAVYHDDLRRLPRVRAVLDFVGVCFNFPSTGLSN